MVTLAVWGAVHNPQSGSQGSESVQYFHNDLSRAILVSIITSISQIPIMVPLSGYVSELLPKPSSAYGWSGGFSPGSPVFAHLR